MIEGVPVDVGLANEGERIRKEEMHLEFGGPKVESKWEIVRVMPPDSVEDGVVRIVGPDIRELAGGGSYPLGILVEVAGPQLEEDFEGIIERRIHEYSNYVEGLMHLNQRYDIWVRLSKRGFKAGFDSLEYLGLVLLHLFKNELPIIEAMQVTFYTEPSAVAERLPDVLARYEARDARARGLTDEEVDTFYGCALCQSFAPRHICIITPERYANCGAISWFDGRAAARMDPKGPIFALEKGECLDPVNGEFVGVNATAKERSMGEVDRVRLYSAFGYPHTSCGCFEGIAFYIPEVEGFGIVHRGFRDPTVNGLAFSTMADSTAGGRQVDGFHGVSLEYLKSRKFLAADGGWDRVVWVPSEILDRLKPFLPEGVAERTATERDVTGVDDLREFLRARDHPVVARWTEEPSGRALVTAENLPLEVGGYRVILKNARIYADRVIVLREEPAHGEGRR
ncbi:MAG: CO dehydrogenase/CO-methylating acetyl-CoA synthase complex subunit beta [Methanospirillum sp.]|nr:CO dehydrogenase/CO-methylating acetyl-CoA synthase complex subunit beta [Methanospirillum sp.]